MARLVLPALSLLVAASIASSQGVRIGERLPPVAIEDLRQSEAHTFQELYGRALLIELFDYWSRPCVISVPRLNHLHETFAARGLSVVAVTKEAARKTVAWVEKHGAEYAYAFDPAGELYRLLEVEETPLAVLVDAHGTVTWIGSPLRLTPEVIEAALQDVIERPVWQWPAPARALAASLQRGEYASALRQAAELGREVDGFDPAACVRGRIAALVARFERLLADGDPCGAHELGKQLQADLAGLPEAAPVTARLEALLADPAARGEIEAFQRLLEFERRLRGPLGPKRLEELSDEVAAFSAQRGGALGARARELLARLERARERAPKPPEDP